MAPAAPRSAVRRRMVSRLERGTGTGTAPSLAAALYSFTVNATVRRFGDDRFKCRGCRRPTATEHWSRAAGDGARDPPAAGRLRPPRSRLMDEAGSASVPPGGSVWALLGRQEEGAYEKFRPTPLDGPMSDAARFRPSSELRPVHPDRDSADRRVEPELLSIPIGRHLRGRVALFPDCDRHLVRRAFDSPGVAVQDTDYLDTHRP